MDIGKLMRNWYSHQIKLFHFFVHHTFGFTQIANSFSHKNMLKSMLFLIPSVHFYFFFIHLQNKTIQTLTHKWKYENHWLLFGSIWQFVWAELFSPDYICSHHTKIKLKICLLSAFSSDCLKLCYCVAPQLC